MKRKGRRISMVKIKEIARLYLKFNLSIRLIARALNISPSTVSIYVDKLKAIGVSYDEISELDDDALLKLICPKEEKTPSISLPDFPYLMKELKKKGVTLQLLYEEYIRDNPSGYKRSQFYKLYRNWIKTMDPVMRITHKAGEKMFVDFSGDKPHYQDPFTGKQIEVELFISALGASSYIFAYALPDQTVESFVKGNIMAFEHYGGCPKSLIIDNLKAGVNHPCYYDPDINRTFSAMATHYNIAVIPTRARRPRDKAKVENAVLQVERRILAALRNRTFFSIHELNAGIREEADKLNLRPLSGAGKSRYDLFVEIEKPALQPLPQERFEIASWKKAKIHIDYHVQVDKSYYSCPYTLIGEYVDIRYTGNIVEIYHKGKRVASHIRSYRPGAYITDNLHMPDRHRKYLEWSPERIRSWGQKIGINTKTLMDAIMEHKTHPEHAFRTCLGIIRLARVYSPERVEMACKKAIDIGAYNYRSIKSLLDRGLENISVREEERVFPIHSNIRGNGYYREASHD